jgi:hypothetical protein
VILEAILKHHDGVECNRTADQRFFALYAHEYRYFAQRLRVTTKLSSLNHSPPFFCRISCVASR